MEWQTTIREAAPLSGVGLHTGNFCRLIFRPAPANMGIRFIRTDLPDSPAIPARVRYVVDTTRGTTLGIGKAVAHTVEHVLAACAGLGIDNLDILMDNNEPPATDGSAMPFLKALLNAGIKAQPHFPKRYLKIPEKVHYRSGYAVYTAYPSDHFEIRCAILHDHPMLPKQMIHLKINPETFLNQIASARTFCFEHELAALRSMGLARGGSLENAVVIGADKFHTKKEGLVFEYEFVLHKVLDLLGDLSLVGRSLFKLRVEAIRCGHAHNVKFAGMLDRSAHQLRKSKEENKC